MSSAPHLTSPYKGEEESTLPQTGGEGGGVSSDALPTEDAEKPKYRQILAGIAKNYSPEELIGRQAVFVANLEPRQMMGMMSQGMILAVTDAEGQVVLLRPDRTVPLGSQAH